MLIPIPFAFFFFSFFSFLRSLFLALISFLASILFLAAAITSFDGGLLLGYLASGADDSDSIWLESTFFLASATLDSSTVTWSENFWISAGVLALSFFFFAFSSLSSASFSSFLSAFLSIFLCSSFEALIYVYVFFLANTRSDSGSRLYYSYPPCFSISAT